MLRGGSSGPAIVPGHSADSLLVKRFLATSAKERMPLGGQPLSREGRFDPPWIDGAHFESEGHTGAFIAHLR